MTAPRVNVVDVDDLSLSARIREAALRLVADQGPQATSIRKIAEEAGVSPGAVTHHFKTKEELLAAVHRSVERRVHDAVAAVSLAGPAVEVIRRRREVYDQFLLDNPDIAAYTRRMYLDGSPNGAAFFHDMLEFVRSEMQLLLDAGLARPMPDPEVGLVVYALLAEIAHIFQPVLEPALGLDLSDPAVINRFRDAVVDLLTTPLFPDRQ